MKSTKSSDKQPQRLLRLLKETMRNLDPDRLSDVAGGTVIAQVTSISASVDIK